MRLRIKAIQYLLVVFFLHEIFFGFFKRILIFTIGKGAVYFAYSSVTNLLPLIVFFLTVVIRKRIPTFHKTAPYFCLYSLLYFFQIFNPKTPFANSIVNFGFIYPLSLYFIIFSVIASLDGEIIRSAVKEALVFSFPVVFIYHLVQYINGPFHFEMAWIENSFSSVWIGGPERLAFRPFATFEGPPYLSFYYFLCAVFVMISNEHKIIKLISVSICFILSLLTLTSTISVAFLVSFTIVVFFCKRLYLIKTALVALAVVITFFLIHFDKIYKLSASLVSTMNNSFLSERISMGTLLGRMDSFGRMIQLIYENPFGYGAGRISLTNLYLGKTLAPTADSGMIAVTINLGLMGLIFLLMFLYNGLTNSIFKYVNTRNKNFKYLATIPIVIFMALFTTEILSYKFVTITAMSIMATIYSNRSIK